MGTESACVTGSRQSTRDLIGALRQQAGLPPPDALLSPPSSHEKTAGVPPGQQSIPIGLAPAAPGMVDPEQQPSLMPAAQPQDRQAVVLKPEPSAASGSSVQVTDT